jgi:hypothetical protein
MHNKYAKNGFAAISVSLDDPKNDKARQRVIDFLTKQKATFTNLILDEESEVWQKKLKFEGPPCVFVFDRDGTWKQYTAPDYAEIEKYVAELMKK